MRIVKYKGVEYEVGNEYNGVLELYKSGRLRHIVKARKNGTFIKWYL